MPEPYVPTLVVGTDTYISLADANIYIAANVLSTDAKYIAWTAMSDANKEVTLRLAAQQIDRQPLAGIKVTSTQVMEFPRVLYTEYPIQTTVNDLIYDNWYVQPSVPDAVKHAQVEIAIQIAAGIPARVEMRQQGVKSFSIGKLSESYTGSASGIITTQAVELLAPYLIGGVRIC